jgi:UDP-N-acetylmuramoyl-tripeptide--D-alanyl-D-alanine ligase
VVELGMNHPGEIARLAAMAKPTIGLVNNAQREHQEFMATVEAVARENGAVFANCPRTGRPSFRSAIHSRRCGASWRARARRAAA